MNHIRAIMLFLFANFVLAIVLLGASNYQTTHGNNFLTPVRVWIEQLTTKNEVPVVVKNETKPAELPVAKKIQVPAPKSAVLVETTHASTAQPASTITATSLNSEITQSVAPANTNSNMKDVCVMYGPLNLEQKATFDVVLDKDNLTSLAQLSQQPSYEIFWNLGNDKAKAVELLESQKNGGPLQDEKFKLKNEGGQYIVPITTISGSSEMAKNLANQLTAASNNKTGGTWEYRSKGDAYYYKFKDLTHVPQSSINFIDRAIHPTKAPC